MELVVQSRYDETSKFYPDFESADGIKNLDVPEEKRFTVIINRLTHNQTSEHIRSVMTSSGSKLEVDEKGVFLAQVRFVNPFTIIDKSEDDKRRNVKPSDLFVFDALLNIREQISSEILRLRADKWVDDPKN